MPTCYRLFFTSFAVERSTTLSAASSRLSRMFLATNPGKKSNDGYRTLSDQPVYNSSCVQVPISSTKNSPLASLPPKVKLGDAQLPLGSKAREIEGVFLNNNIRKIFLPPPPRRPHARQLHFSLPIPYPQCPQKKKKKKTDFWRRNPTSYALRLRNPMQNPRELQRSLLV